MVWVCSATVLVEQCILEKVDWQWYFDSAFLFLVDSYFRFLVDEIPQNVTQFETQSTHANIEAS